MPTTGHLEQTSKNRWRIVINAGKDPVTGKYKRIVKRIKGNKAEAEALKALLITEMEKGTYITPTEITVSEWLDTWLMEYKSPGLRATTFESYSIEARTHICPTVGHIKLKDLRPDHLQALYNKKHKSGLSARTVRYLHQILHGALKQAVKNQLVIRNVAEATELPKNEYREAKAMTITEMKKFLNILEDNRLKAAFIVLLGTGLRRGELLALKWENVNLKEGFITVKEGLVWVSGKGIIINQPKTEKSKRTIPLPDNVLNEIKKHKVRQAEEKLKIGDIYQDHGLVFCTELGTPIIPRNFDRTFHSLLKKADLMGIKLHSLRHTYATRLLEAGENLKVVSDLLGHSRINITADIYSHVSPELKREAAAKLNNLFSVSTNLTPKKNSGD